MTYIFISNVTKFVSRLAKPFLRYLAKTLRGTNLPPPPPVQIGLKMSSFRSKSDKKLCRNQSKSVKFVTSCAGHVDEMKK